MGYPDLHEVIREWRQEHPHATFAEMEEEIQQHLARLQAALLAEVVAPVRTTERPLCVACAVPMQSAGQRRRRIQTSMGQDVPVERTYYVCPVCGAGLFPPG